MKAALATKTETEGLSVLMQALQASFDAHFKASFATAHHTVSCIPGGAYHDSNGDIIGNKLLEVPINGVTYYVPCTIVIGDAPTS